MKEQAKVHNIAITLFQETKLAGYTETVVDKHMFFLFGQENTERRAGGGIMLSPDAIEAWKHAGSPNPKKIICANAGWILGIELHFLDDYDHLLKIFVISAHLPHTGYDNDDYDACLEELIHMIDSCTNDVIPMIGADLNARIGTRNDHHIQNIKSYIGNCGESPGNDKSAD